MRWAASLLMVAASVGSLAVASSALAQVKAPQDVAAAIAELRAENAKLAARVAELERENEERHQAALPAAPAMSATADRTEQAPALAPAASAPSQPTQLAAQTLSGQPIVGSRDVALTIPPAPLDRPIQGGGVGLQLNASSAGGQVAISFGQSVRKTAVAYDQVSASGTTWTITASAPIDKKGGDTALATLDSFTDSSTLKVGIAKLYLTLPNLLTDPERIAIEDAAIAACSAAAKNEAGKSTCLETAVDEDFIRAWLPNKVKRYAEINAAQRSGWGFGLEGTVGYRRFSFLDSATLTMVSSDRVPWGVRVFGTWLPRTSLAFTASAAYQRAYEEKSLTILCPAVATEPTIACLTGADGQPVRRNKVLLALDGRKLFDLSQTSLANGVIDRFAIAPQFTWDANNKDVGFDFPIYLVPDDKGNLIGGIRLGYRSGDNGFIAGVFVGGAFDLFKH